MKQILRVLFALSVLGLLGCSTPTPAERAAANERRQAYAQEQAKAEKAALLEKTRAFQKICNSYGFKYKTPEMAQCVASETRQARESRERKRQAALDAFIDNADRFVADENRRIDQFNSRQRTTSCNTFGSNINCVSR